MSISLPSILTLSTVAFPVTANVAPLNVRFALSSSSPPVPAITTRLSVRSSTIKVLAVTHEGDTIQLDVNSLRPRVYQNIYHTYPYYHNYWRPSTYYWNSPYYYSRPSVNYTVPNVSKPYKPSNNAMPAPTTGSGPNTSSPNLATPPSTSTTTIKKKNR